MKRSQKNGIEPSSLSLVMAMIFQHVFPVWKRHQGQVSEYDLQKLDKDGDFPAGIASLAVKRLNRDPELCRQLEEWYEQRPQAP